MTHTRHIHHHHHRHQFIGSKTRQSSIIIIANKMFHANIHCKN